MAKKLTHNYTPEQLSTWDLPKLNTLRLNALKHEAPDLVEMCDNELAKRAPARPRQKLATSEQTGDDYVSEYHFVCSKGRGVTEDKDGRFWSGSWAVSEDRVQQSIKYGASLALHESKAELSYRQGHILNYRRAPRSMVDKDNDGIEFLLEEASAGQPWVGSGAGEKGYRWEKLTIRSGNQQADTEEPNK